MKQKQVLFSSEEMLLRPRSWIDNSVLEFEGEKWVDNDYLYTIFQYDPKHNAMVFSGTVHRDHDNCCPTQRELTVGTRRVFGAIAVSRVFQNQG